MKISSGLSEITIPPRLQGAQAKKAYVWAQYNNGRVRPVPVVNRRRGDELYYIKPSREREALVHQKAQQRDQFEYTAQGNLIQKNRLASAPGSFFNAYA
jgi:hypothetical protein